MEGGRPEVTWLPVATGASLVGRGGSAWLLLLLLLVVLLLLAMPLPPSAPSPAARLTIIKTLRLLLLLLLLLLPLLFVLILLLNSEAFALRVVAAASEDAMENGFFTPWLPEPLPVVPPSSPLPP